MRTLNFPQVSDLGNAQSGLQNLSGAKMGNSLAGKMPRITKLVPTPPCGQCPQGQAHLVQQMMFKSNVNNQIQRPYPHPHSGLGYSLFALIAWLPERGACASCGPHLTPDFQVLLLSLPSLSKRVHFLVQSSYFGHTLYIGADCTSSTAVRGSVEVDFWLLSGGGGGGGKLC